MKQVLLQKAIKLNKERKRRQHLRKLVQVMASVVVFCTTYVLILPAITMEQETICGIDAHTHGEKCYESYPYYRLSCSLVPDEDTVVLHTHGRECYEKDGSLRCGLQERPVHQHDDQCYGDPEILCSLTETEDHVHSESCTTERILQCTLQETPGHTHDATCSKQEQVLVCTVKEGQGHSHSEACTGVQQVLVCGQEETEGHTHSDSCTGTEQNLICVQTVAEGHTHQDSCYETYQKTCDLEENESHVHSDACTGTEQNLICVQEASEGHTHGDSCYETRRKTCDLAETPAHSHTEACYEDREISCALEETEAHVHSDACYEIQLTGCTMEESAPHAHTDACYEIRTVECTIPEVGHTHQETCFGEKKLECRKEEITTHHHDENCYDSKGVMNCGLPEILEHVHGADCLQDTGEMLRELICTRQEHAHEDICYADADSPEALEFLCGFGEHTHEEACADAEGNQICTIPEHVHSAACVLEDLDLTAGVETSDVWDAMFREIRLTGNWPEDLLAVARSQSDYRESKRNCVLADQSLKGYTRYGDRFGDPYGDWAGYFVRFCIAYAEIEQYPQQDTPVSWITQLQQEELFRSAEDYVPKAGDLMFICRNAELAADETVTPEEKLLLADHVGIVEQVIPATDESPMKIRTIEGDVKDRVCYVTYELQDQRILGFGEMLPGYATEMQFAGEDYSVTVSLPREAKIPAAAELTVREILPGAEEYDAYYRQSVEAMLVQRGDESEEDLGITFARFFDIGFVVDGEKLEPEAPVSVQIQYTKSIDMGENQAGTAVHFADSGIELLKASLSGAVPVSAATAEANSEETAPAEETVRRVDTFSFTQDSFSVVATFMANARAIEDVDVWLDGTCGGLMAYTGAKNSWTTLKQGVLPKEVPEDESPTEYKYILRGWYDVTHSKYYPAGATVDETVTKGTVFYADWIAESYNIGYDNGHTVNSLDTSEFITTHVFDYNALFNVQSSNAEVTVTNINSTNRSHSERWSLVKGTGTVDYNDAQTLDFVFRDHDSTSDLTYPNMSGGSDRNAPSELNGITENIYTDRLGDILFEPRNVVYTEETKDEFVIGKNYLGQGNYLYQYQGDAGEPYYGYYYYDSFKNAASYNASANRFYIYDYLEYTKDTADQYDDTNADFLPLNMPSINADLNSQVIYASRSNQNYDQMTNYFFGMTSNIHFYLPNDAGATDPNGHGNYLNKSTTGANMVFEFYGDDDVWVLLDGKPLLDIGGIHMVQGGKIDFSEGKVYASKYGDSNFRNYVEVADISGKTAGSQLVKAGSHNLTICYLERGSSMSNCAIYFNLAPRYGLDLVKRDFTTGELLPGVEFEVRDETGDFATLWPSHDLAKEDSENQTTDNVATSFSTDPKGIAHMWGFVAGKTYYIKETAVPDGYPRADATIRVTLNNHGTDVAEITVIRGEGETAGFEVTGNTMDKEHHMIELTLTNRKTEDGFTAIRAQKQWASGTTEQKPIAVYLKAGDTKIGESVTLSNDNAWGHSWLNLPEKDASGEIIDYTVGEDWLAGYNLDGIETTYLNTELISWAKVGALENDAIFLLQLSNGKVLTWNENDDTYTFGSGDLKDGKNNRIAWWRATAYQDGFRLGNGEVYLAYNGTDFVLTDGESGNQTFYFDGTYLFAMQNNERKYLGTPASSGNTVSVGSGGTGVYKQVVTPEQTKVYVLTNSMIPEEQQKNLRILKTWEPADHVEIPKKLQVHVKKDNEIVTTVELTPENRWSAVVEGLDETFITQEKGGYTLEEVVPFGFVPEYGAFEEVSIDRWNQVNGTGLEQGKVYVFASGNRALADVDGTLKATNFNSASISDNQKWEAVKSGNIMVLRNKGTDWYVSHSTSGGFFNRNHKWEMIQTTNNGCSVALYNGKLLFEPTNSSGTSGTSFKLNDDGTVSHNNSPTTFTVYQHEYREEYQVTIVNTYGTYVLPETGGMGTGYHYALGGLLSMAAALLYLFAFGRRRRKGGR